MNNNDQIDLKSSAKDNVVNVINNKNKKEDDKAPNAFVKIVNVVFVKNFKLKILALLTSVVLFVISGGM